MAERMLPVLPDYQPGRWAVHTAYSDPGRFGPLLDAVPGQDRAASTVARNLIVHYRASEVELPEGTRSDVNARWIAKILELDQQRHPADLGTPRAESRRVQGCCRDHSLLAAAILRQHGIAARIRYGFAGYFVEEFQVDHVVVETWEPQLQRWRRFDPEVASPLPRLASPRDIPAGRGAPFVTAAEVWRGYRAGEIDPDRYGVDPATEVRGVWFIHDAVILDAAFRAGHELLLWDAWDPMTDPSGPTEEQAGSVDRLASLIVAADAGDLDAERELIASMTDDPQLRPPDVVNTICPWGDPPVRSELRRGPAAVQS
ncbi:transglutaminase-like domain-containing protein [Microlunatus soli]|uniref:Transglutaminase-like superfamily protein n=1 Tax=Microlunatus soli TaxID=630515 RepID=A0A1H1QU21_9ACTN|nr:transglutaminase-like domain-containing protein [Microlunatus soli]SDS26981.1 Transglutaminase-like superfamily protein [Microlunatus soli]